MKAVIRHGGKQYYVTEGTVLFLEKIAANENDTVTFDEVLMLDDKIGNPLVKGATVSGKVLKQGKGKKIIEENKDTDNLIQKLKLQRLMVNYD